MADSQHTIRRAVKGEAPSPSRRALIAGSSTAFALFGLASASTVANLADDTVAQCGLWLTLEAKVDKLWDEWADLEVKLSKENASFFKLPDEERYRLPGGGGRMLEIEQTAERLRFFRDALLLKLPRLKAHTTEAVLAKLVVASRLIIPEHEPEASRIVRDSVKDLCRLHKLKA